MSDLAHLLQVLDRLVDRGSSVVIIIIIISDTLCGVTHAQFEGHREEITVNEQGRVTIPVQVRRAAGIEAGVPLVVYVEDGRVVIETRDQLADRIRRDVAATWTGDGSVVDELITDRRAEAVREEQR